MPRLDWNNTIDTIKSGKCILFLGPEIYNNDEGKLEERLLKYLDLQDDPEVQVYDDGLFFFRDGQRRTDTYLRMRRFFENEDFSAAKNIMQKIARIPFHFIITTTPDNLLVDTFQELNFKVNSGYYWKNTPPDPKVTMPSVEMPMVYNVLGNIGHPESLVLTHDDLYDYLESIFQAKSMPEKLRYHIMKEAQNLIFLGIPFDRWYMQIILRMLNLHIDKDVMRFAIMQEVSDEVETLCKDEFQINFIQHRIVEFIDEMYDRCEQEGILRTADETEKMDVEKMKTLVAEDRLPDVFAQLNKYLAITKRGDNDLSDELTLLENRHSRLTRKIHQGILSEEQISLAENKLRNDLLYLLNETIVLT
ncbi:MAG: SIR2 family protein [Saprospiraceae bacterium]|jgi:hypothetical protein